MSDTPAVPSVRVDKWLWYARFFKSRSLATKLVQARKVRINSIPTDKPSAAVRADDVLTFAQGKHIRVVRIRDIGKRRGPAVEAQRLYEDLAPPQTRDTSAARQTAVARREAGSGRPTKAERRALDRLRDTHNDPDS